MRHETIETNVFFLRVESQNAPSLRPASTHNGSSSRSYQGEYQLVNMQFVSLAYFLEAMLSVPVIDQTGLTGNYDANLKWNYRNDLEGENLKRAVNEQLGLKLVPGTALVEMLVVEKAK